MPKFINNCGELTATSGTGPYSFSGGLPLRTLAESLSDGDEVAYSVFREDQSTTEYELGIGTWSASASTLARTTILESSNSDAAVNWGTTDDKRLVITATSSMLLDVANLSWNNAAVDTQADAANWEGFTFDTSVAHTQGNVMTVKINGTEVANIDDDGWLNNGAFNHLWFGVDFLEILPNVFFRGVCSFGSNDMVFNYDTTNARAELYTSTGATRDLRIGGREHSYFFGHHALGSIELFGDNAGNTASNLANSTGGQVHIKSGDAGNNSNNAPGGDLTLEGGSGGGTGRDGQIIVLVPTSDPLVAGALWNSSGTLKVSAG